MHGKINITAPIIPRHHHKGRMGCPEAIRIVTEDQDLTRSRKGGSAAGTNKEPDETVYFLHKPERGAAGTRMKLVLSYYPSGRVQLKTDAKLGTVNHVIPECTPGTPSAVSRRRRASGGPPARRCSPEDRKS